MLAGTRSFATIAPASTSSSSPDGNGFLLDSDNFWQVVETFERILNRRKTTNEQLAGHVGPIPRDRDGYSARTDTGR